MLWFHDYALPCKVSHFFDPPGIPPQTFQLKIGGLIMLLCNRNPPKLYNWTSLQLDTIHIHVIEASFFIGVNQDEIVFIPWISLIPSDYLIQFKRFQYRVKLYYVMTNDY